MPGDADRSPFVLSGHGAVVMNISKNGAILMGILVILLVVCGYMWIEVGTSEAQIDPKVAEMVQEYYCDNCDQTFELTTAESAQSRRINGDILCPKCGKGAISTAVLRAEIKQKQKLDDADRTGEAPPAPKDMARRAVEE